MTTLELEQVDAPKVKVPNGKKPRRLLKRADILKKRPPRFAEVPTDEWEEGSAVRVARMDFDSQEIWELAQTQLGYSEGKESDQLRGVRTKIIARCIVDEHNAPEMTEADVDALAAEDAAPMKRIWNAILALTNGATINDQIEDAAGNSPSVR